MEGLSNYCRIKQEINYSIESMRTLVKLFLNDGIIADFSFKKKIEDLQNELQREELEHYHLAINEKISNELKLLGCGAKTRKVYINHIKRFLAFVGKKIVDIQLKDIEQCLLYLIEEKKCSHSYVNQAVSALKFFCQKLLNKKQMAITIPRPKNRADPL